MKKETLTVETDEHGTVRYYKASGERHNPNGPAIVDTHGSKSYWINGELHNPDGPAVVWADGSKRYYINGKLHNPDGPAVVGAGGSKWYYINGEQLSETGFTAWQAQQVADTQQA